MANTYEAIATVTVGSGGATTIDFTSIPATYTDLILKLSGRDNRADESFTALFIKVNNSTSNLTTKRLYGNGASAFSDSPAGFIGTNTAPLATASTFSNLEIYFPNYAGSTNKSFSSDAVTENNATTSFVSLNAGLWSQTTAINQLTVYCADSANFVQYSTATLYGIKNS